MMTDNRPVWQKLAGSRKVWVAICGIVTTLAAKYGFKVDQELVNGILLLHGLVIAAMGWEDAAEKRSEP